MIIQNVVELPTAVPDHTDVLLQPTLFVMNHNGFKSVDSRDNGVLDLRIIRI